MLKNFSPHSLGINGRQSELIELALTYGFRSMDVDLTDMLRRCQRTSMEDATKYLRATELMIGGFAVDVDLNGDDAKFSSQVTGLHPLADLAAQMKASRAYVMLPPATDTATYHEFYETQRTRLAQIVDVLSSKNIRLAIGFQAGKELEEGKQFPFVRNAEGFISLVKSVDGAGFLIDTWDWVVGDGAMDQLSELAADEIVAVRLGSLAADADPSTATSSDRVLPEQEGLLNHVNLVKHLSTIGFEGPISPTASSSRYKGQTRESTVQKSQEAVDGICKAAGLHVAPLPMDTIEDIPYEPTVRA